MALTGVKAIPAGYQWSIATHKEDLTQEQIRKRGEQFFASHSSSDA